MSEELFLDFLRTSVEIVKNDKFYKLFYHKTSHFISFHMLIVEEKMDSNYKLMIILMCPPPGGWGY